MEIAILNFCSQRVYLFTVPEDCTEESFFESDVAQDLNLRAEDCHFMFGKIEVIDERKKD